VHPALRAAFLGQLEEIAGSADHDPLELLRPPLPDGDEVDDDIGARARAAEARRVGDVALDQLAPELREITRFPAVADETAHRPVVGSQRADDVAPDEACAPGDEDHFASPSSPAAAPAGPREREFSSRDRSPASAAPPPPDAAGGTVLSGPVLASTVPSGPAPPAAPEEVEVPGSRLNFCQEFKQFSDGAEITLCPV